MRTINLYFKNIQEIQEYQRIYSTTYRKIYNNIEKIHDKDYIEKLMFEEPLLLSDNIKHITKEIDVNTKIQKVKIRTNY